MTYTNVYPTGIDTLNAVVAGVTQAQAAQINALFTAAVAIETELGISPSSTSADVTTRLSKSLDGGGNIAFVNATTLTISGGSITVTQNFHRVDTEGAASTDDLVTISGGGTQALLLVLRLLSASHNVVIKHNGSGGNIQCVGGVDITLDNAYDFAILIYDPTQAVWLALSAGTLTAAATLGGINVWTAMNTWSAAVNYAYLARTTNITLDATKYMVNMDASGGAKTVTLPTAIGITGRHYIIRKKDSSANAVTVDGDGSETINGATTYALTAQYQSVSLMSDGAGWMVL